MNESFLRIAEVGLRHWLWCDVLQQSGGRVGWVDGPFWQCSTCGRIIRGDGWKP